MGTPPYAMDWPEDPFEIVSAVTMGGPEWVVEVVSGLVRWPTSFDQVWKWRLTFSWKDGFTNNPGDGAVLQKVLRGVTSGAWLDFRSVPVETYPTGPRSFDTIQYQIPDNNDRMLRAADSQFFDVAGNPLTVAGLAPGYQLVSHLYAPDETFPPISGWAGAYYAAWRTGAITPDSPPGAVDYWKMTAEPAAAIPAFIDGEDVELLDAPPGP